jgi:hypothetical protein
LLISTSIHIRLADRNFGLQQARGNKDDFERLATDACDLVYVVLNIYKAQSNEQNEMPNELEGELKALVKCVFLEYSHYRVILTETASEEL